MKKLLFIILALFCVSFYLSLTTKVTQAEDHNSVSQMPDVYFSESDLPQANSEDVVGQTLKELSDVFDYLKKDASNDSRLMQLISVYEKNASTKDQLVSDFRKLQGLRVDFIGQWHVGLGSEDAPIDKIQKKITEMVRSNYDVIWVEDFVGGGVITSENAWKQVYAEGLEADIAIPGMAISEDEAKQFVRQNIHLSASFKLIHDSGFHGELRAADFRYLKMIQQYLMSYAILFDKGLPLPAEITPEKFHSILQTLSNARDLYVLQLLAGNVDPSKKNVLVFGSFHSEHIARIMANYGMKAKLYQPSIQ